MTIMNIKFATNYKINYEIFNNVNPRSLFKHNRSKTISSFKYNKFKTLGNLVIAEEYKRLNNDPEYTNRKGDVHIALSELSHDWNTPRHKFVRKPMYKSSPTDQIHNAVVLTNDHATQTTNDQTTQTVQERTTESNFNDGLSESSWSLNNHDMPKKYAWLCKPDGGDLSSVSTSFNNLSESEAWTLSPSSGKCSKSQESNLVTLASKMERYFSTMQSPASVEGSPYSDYHSSNYNDSETAPASVAPSPISSESNSGSVTLPVSTPYSMLDVVTPERSPIEHNQPNLLQIMQQRWNGA